MADAPADATPKTISRAEAREMVEAGAQLVDVRAEHEWETGHLPGATHIPLAELSARVEEIDKDRPVIFYCRGGNRSSMATTALAEAGYDAVKLSEGAVGWEEEGLPFEPEGGYVAESGEAAAVLEARKRAS
ncbi:MAG: rhodanese-like domain-containing protein [Actinobacteria bacterium]|nr:rhodanese-like domain-containing protein [Actinomycetota bacterium]MBS1883787.1 rhodanese-like domain-containing protein [Actinomycetota bacterium]